MKKTKWMCIRSALAGLGRVAHVLHANNEEVEQVDEFRSLLMPIWASIVLLPHECAMRAGLSGS